MEHQRQLDDNWHLDGYHLNMVTNLLGRGAEYYLGLGVSADVVKSIYNSVTLTRAIVFPVVKTHTFGGVVFEETGEIRQVNKNDWYIDGRVINNWFVSVSSLCKWTIVKPISILPQEGESHE